MDARTASSSLSSTRARVATAALARAGEFPVISRTTRMDISANCAGKAARHSTRMTSGRLHEVRLEHEEQGGVPGAQATLPAKHVEGAQASLYVLCLCNADDKFLRA